MLPFWTTQKTNIHDFLRFKIPFPKVKLRGKGSVPAGWERDVPPLEVINSLSSPIARRARELRHNEIKKSWKYLEINFICARYL